MNGLRLFLDGTMARGGGGFTYLANIVPRLLEDEEMEIRLELRHAPLAEALPRSPRLELALRPPAGWGGRLADAFLTLGPRARAWGADLFLSAGELLPPLRGLPGVACFRNPNLVARPEEPWPPAQRLRLAALRRLARSTARRAARVVFVSRDSARWMGDALGVDPERRAVIHHGIDPAPFQGTVAAPPLARPYLLSVSSIYRYKNFVTLIRAWDLVARARPGTPDLAIVGDDQDPPYSAAMRRARAACGPRAERVHLVGAVPYREIPKWYGGARAFVFPSRLETFGHPLLEALAAGIPVVASDLPVFREIGGDAVHYVDTTSPEPLAEALAGVLGDPAAAARREAGLARVREFGWDAAARRLRDLLRTLAAGRRRDRAREGGPP